VEAASLSIFQVENRKKQEFAGDTTSHSGVQFPFPASINKQFSLLEHTI
jgi:hypothetical protein